MTTKLAAVFVLSLVGMLAHAVERVTAREVDFDIPAQSLTSALLAFSAQTGLQVITAGTTVPTRDAEAVVGKRTIESALHTLLNGTGLEYRTVGETTITLVVSRPAASAERAEKGLRIAEGNTVEERKQQSESKEEAQQDGESLDEVVVTGTHIRGTAPVGAPLVTYDREEILQTGVATIEQFARHMPQNFASADSASRLTTSARGLDQTGANLQGGTGFNIRGVGPAATLTLVNGRRMAPAGASGQFVDISLIPLAAVSRIDVLTDGASALYGADAVAGVVNIVLRRDFRGAETALRYGSAMDEGMGERTASQLLGTSWSSGNAMIAYEYNDSDGLRSDQRDYVTQQPGPNRLWPEQTRHSAYANFQQDVFGSTTLSLDGYYSDRKFSTATTAFGTTTFESGPARQYGGNLGVSGDLPGGWQASLYESVSRVDQPNTSLTPAFDLLQLNTTGTQLTSTQLLFEGPLLALRGQDVRAALGADYRKEQIDTSQSVLVGGTVVGTFIQPLSRNVSSVYSELLVPLMGDEEQGSLGQRLELSVAARYDHYSDAGSRTSPKVGLRWSATRALAVRASYAESFHPPFLFQLAATPNGFTFNAANPSSATGTTNTLFIQGNGSATLRPETAESFTAGVDFSPADVPGLRISGSYFRIEFQHRIARPPILGGNILGVWQQTATLAPFFDLSPSLAEVQALFDTGAVFDIAGLGPEGVEALFDNRPQNIAKTTEAGFSGSVDYKLPTPAGELAASVAVEYVTQHDYQAASTVPSVALGDTLGAPVDLRIHGVLGWSRGGFGSALILNHWGSYENPLFTPAQHIASWTTADLHLSYRTGAGIGMPLLQNFTVSATLQNLADRAPPPVAVPVGFVSQGFDPANATPFGRMLALQASKQW